MANAVASRRTAPDAARPALLSPKPRVPSRDARTGRIFEARTAALARRPLWLYKSGLRKSDGWPMLVRRLVPVLTWLTLAAVSLHAVPAAMGQPATREGGLAPATLAPQQVAAGAVAPNADAVPPAEPITTRYAYFVPARFGDLPGWHADDLADAWKAFRAGCNALANRSAWAGPCRRAPRDNASDGDVRRFLEREFALYQINSRDQSPAGVITGYYEPLLHGSRHYGAPYIFPVYGVPADLLYLDSRSIPRTSDGSPVYARVEGRAVVPMCSEPAAEPGCRGPYVLDVGKSKPDIRDKRLRVRVDGRRVVPYFTRAEIENGALAADPAIVWVDNRAALYAMQIQGSGKVQLPDGQVVRLAYGEQNGHPFIPPVRKKQGVLTRGIPVFTRGLDIPLDDAEAGADDENQEAAAADAASGTGLLLRGAPPASPQQGSSRTPAGADEELSPEVARMVELLLKGTEPQGPQDSVPAKTQANEQGQRPPANSPPSTAKSPLGEPSEPRPAIESRPKVAKATPAQPHETRPASAAAAAPGKATTPAAATGGSAIAGTAPPTASSKSSPSGPASTGTVRPSPFSSDPSYVFFREIPDGEGGPVGALGVPLTAGRSIAVDPRTTPLGAPVFVTTAGPNLGRNVSRLMFAQDTGGAIRGAVRADYFWGFGPRAGELAGRMKEFGRMWLLLPRELAASMGAAGIATRGGAGVTATGDAECLIPDPDLCVE
jgi:membrane-bound lytic murein transglycosylase A